MSGIALVVSSLLSMFAFLWGRVAIPISPAENVLATETF